MFNYVVALTNIEILGKTYKILPTTVKVCKGIQKYGTYSYVWQKTIHIK